MTTKLSAKGQIVIPAPIRESEQLRPGDDFLIETRSGTIVLQKIAPRARQAKLVIGPNGLPLFVTPKGSPKITLEMAKQLDAELP